MAQNEKAVLEAPQISYIDYNGDTIAIIPTEGKSVKIVFENEVINVKCHYPCIYYREIQDSNKKAPRLICDFKGEELKFLTKEELLNCKHFKSFGDIK